MFIYFYFFLFRLDRVWDEVTGEEMDQQRNRKLMSRVRAQGGIDEPSPSSKCRSESALISNGATEFGCLLVESDYHFNNEYE